MNLNRRGFLSGLAAAFAAPAVISASSLMPLRGVKLLVPTYGLRLVSETLGIDVGYDEMALAGLDGAAAPDLFDMMNKSLLRAPLGWIKMRSAQTSDLRFEATQDVANHMQVQAIRKSNVLIAPTLLPYQPSLRFRNIPIEVVEA